MKIVLISSAVLLIVTALSTQGVIKSLAELGAFLIIVFYLFSRQRQPSK
ncbi:hypothetical protein [Vibrio algarum]|uniref:O-succinylbenzoic acid--CoA ligase n=1 Tax=Vibrio algarum TaxID=3020714 RepID=A0ABT4YSB8_9VIBR|nr:hypothetical protein [Vibrio sp. KJ40-1]MDB1124463.1 hypothetical protein [Vibrio sp. KJ40-1]